MPGTRVTLEGFPSLDKAVAGFIKRGGNLGEIGMIIAQDLAARVEDNFQKESGFRQGKWPKLSPETIKRMKPSRRASSFKILQDRGQLASSITPHSDGTYSEAYTNVKYAKFHVSSLPRKKIPLRDFLDIDLEGVMRETAELLLGEVSPP